MQHHVIREKKLSEREALSIFYNVVCVVNKLHEKNVIHRDLKLGNIVLNCRYVINDNILAFYLLFIRLSRF